MSMAFPNMYERHIHHQIVLVFPCQLLRLIQQNVNPRGTNGLKTTFGLIPQNIALIFHEIEVRECLAKSLWGPENINPENVFLGRFWELGWGSRLGLG